MLHIVKHYRHLSDALTYLQQEDALLLVEDAVYAALRTHKAHALLVEATCRQFVLSEDVNARGLMLNDSNEITAVDFVGFVELTEEHIQSLTWN